jgi:hypothetical protein
VQRATAEALEGLPRGPRVTRKDQLRLRAQDPALKKRLADARDGSNEWFYRYVDVFLKSPDFERDLAQFSKRLEDLGWRVASISPIENLADEGLILDVLIEKLLKSEAQNSDKKAA